MCCVGFWLWSTRNESKRRYPQVASAQHVGGSPYGPAKGMITYQRVVSEIQELLGNGIAPLEDCTLVLPFYRGHINTSSHVLYNLSVERTVKVSVPFAYCMTA